MKIYYQGEPGAYSNLASIECKKNIKTDILDIVGLKDFTSVWQKISNNCLGVLPIENSYAGNIHENLYNFLRYDFKIIGEINLEVNHCLLSNEKDISKIKKVISHPQALSQCHTFLNINNFKSESFVDTAGAALEISKTKQMGIGAIASSLAGKHYGLNIIKEGIQDQDGNTTRFLIVADKEASIKYNSLKGKVSIVFEAKNIPSSLYKCLGAFATNNVNLTKIESMPSLKGPFSYLFWLDFEGSLGNEDVKKSLNELDFFTNYIKVLGEY